MQSAYGNAQLGKLPPQALDLEEAVLGALMIEKDAIIAVEDLLHKDSFYKEAHKEIYAAILALSSETQPIDMLTVTQQLRKMGRLEAAGGASYIMKLTSYVNSAANIEAHARIITEQSIKRELITLANEIQKEAYEDSTDVFDLLDQSEQRIFEISEVNISKKTTDIRSALQEALLDLENKKHLKDGLTGVPTGFNELDRITAGWQKSDLIIVAARPAMGKTAFALSMLRNAAIDFNMPVAIFSLEMSTMQLVNRLISAEAELESDKIKKGNLADYEWQQLYSRITRLTESKIFIDDTPGISINELRGKARKLKAQHDIQLIIVDYLQQMTAGGGGSNGKGFGGNREQEIAQISRGLKILAKELNIPVISLAQLSRAVETRGGDKKPMLSDLRESGCITGDRLVLNADTGELVPIRELAERKDQTSFTCFGVNGDYKVKPQNLIKAFYSGKKEVFELKTRSGKSIKASANHPFMKLEGWTRLDKLAVGDKIATPRKITIEKPTNPISKDELILLAHLLGDGCILPKMPYHYTSADMANIEIVQTAARNLFNIESRIVKQENWWHVYLTSPYHLTHNVKHPITLWYERMGIDRVRSYDKRLPASLFQSDEEHIALFLKHLWATDGNVSWKKIKGRIDSGAIYYGSSSKTLSQQVQHLLLRLGIQSTIRINKKEGYRNNYHVCVQGAESQLAFLKLVGCYGKRGEIIPEMIDCLGAIEINTNLDVIPKQAWKLIIEPAKNKVAKSWRVLSNDLEISYSGSGLFKSGIGRKRVNTIAKVLDSKELKNLAESDILWDEISSITSLGVEDVYDATVEGVHNFIANDIVLHNSIEQDADMVLFLYRPEYYGLTQDSNGNPTAGLAEVIIAKHRNGGLGDVQLRFKGKYTKFENIEADNFRISSIATNGLESFESGANSIISDNKNDSNLNINLPPENPDDVPF